MIANHLRYLGFRAATGKWLCSYSHSHADHYGGVRGVIDEADVEVVRSR